MNDENEYKKRNIEIKLTIRKKEINEILDSNRKIENFEFDNNKQMKNYILDIEDISIPQTYQINNLKEFFSSVNKNLFNLHFQFNINLLLDYLTSYNENINLYGAYIIKNYLSEENIINEQHLNILSNQITNKILSILVNLLSKNNNKLSYVIIWILINLASTDINEEIFLKENNIIYILANYLGKIKKDEILTYRGIYLLRNISYKNINIQEILLNYNIFGYCYEIFKKYLFDNHLAHNIIKLLGNFTFEINMKFVKQYLILFDMIKSYLNKTTEVKKLNKYIMFLNNLCISDSDEIIEYFFKKEIYKNLIDVYPFYDDIINSDEENNLNKLRILILKLFGKITSIEDKNQLNKSLIDFGIFNFFNKIIDSFEFNNNYKIIKNLLLSITNLSIDLDYPTILYNTGIISKLIKLGEIIYNSFKESINYNKDLIISFRELCKTFSIIIKISLYKDLIPVIQCSNYLIIIFLIEGLSLFEKKKDLIELIFEALYKLVEYDKIMEEYNKNIRNDYLNDDFSQIMDRNGIKNVLDNYIFDKRKDINILANKLFKKIYD